jgi:hypothetical protein
MDTIRDVPRESLTTTAGSLHPNKNEPDLCKQAHPDAQEVTEGFFEGGETSLSFGTRLL